MPSQVEVNPNPQPAPAHPGDVDFKKFWVMRCGDYTAYEIAWTTLGTRGYLARHSDGRGWYLGAPADEGREYEVLPADEDARLVASAYFVWRAGR
jgi:hypothetical protein